MLRMRRWVLNPAKNVFSGVWLLCVVSIPLTAQTLQSEPLPAGQLLEKVTCKSDATQSYALYLPSSYSASRPWPIVYLFDPVGRGKLPVTMYKDAAEKYGFILAGSNNSRNFGSDESQTLNALWQDTHSRLALDPHRTYTSGFSGGARVAGSLPVSCPQCQIAGVIAHGAGYPGNRRPGKDALLYFLAVGDQDFNWPEVTAIRRQREEEGSPYRLHVFPGSHQWAPPAVMEEALEWMTLKSMQAGDLPPDRAFVDRTFMQVKAELENAETQKDAFAQLAACRALVSDFKGLRDVAVYEEKLTALRKSPELKSAMRKEQESAFEQNQLEGEISSKLNALIDGTVDDPISLQREVVQAMSHLQDQAVHQKNESQRLIAKRAFDGVWVSGIESGQREFQLHHYSKAEACFRLMSSVRNDPWPVLLLAEVHAAMGNKKEAMKDVREAVHRGIKDAATLETDDRLQPLQGEPEFQKLVNELHSAKSGGKP